MADNLAVFHHKDPVGKIEDIVNIVADEEDADALPFQLLDEIAHLRRLLRPECRRWLIHDQDTGIEQNSTGNGDGLPLATGQRLHRLLEPPEIGVETPHHLAG